jgi:phosphoglucomutase
VDRGRANELIRAGSAGVRGALRARAGRDHGYDFLGTYVEPTCHVVDLDAIRAAGRPHRRRPARRRVGRLLGGRSPSGTARPHRRQPARRPDVAFMTLDWDGKIRMDCSSPSRDGLADRQQATPTTSPPATTPTPTGTASSPPTPGLMNPNHYLAVAIQYLYGARASGLAGGWRHRQDPGVVSMIDRVAAESSAAAGRGAGRLQVVRARPARRIGRLRRRGVGGRVVPAPDGTVWTTDKDGILLALLASEILAVTGKSPSSSTPN